MRTSPTWLALGLGIFVALSPIALAAPEKLETTLTPDEIARETQAAVRFPHFMHFLKTVQVAPSLLPTDPRNSAIIPTSRYFDPPETIWSEFFKSAADDHLTCLRAFGLLAREIKKRGYVVFGSGVAFEKAVRDGKIDLGLALPAYNIGAAIWAPDPSVRDPEFQVHLKLFYTTPFIHKFPDEVLPANLKIGYGEEVTYWYGGQELHQHTVDADVYDGPQAGIGFLHVKGIGGQKRGFLGLMQKMFFFLPDAISSMTINENRGTMVTEAMINTTVQEFEKNPIYAIKIKP